MLESTAAGLLGKALIFLPVHSDHPHPHGMSTRLILRSIVAGYLFWAFALRCFVNRGSPRSVWMRNLCDILVCATLVATSIFEMYGGDTGLREYNELLLSIVESLIAVCYCCNRALHLCALPPGPFLARLTSLWKIYHLVNGTYDEKILHLHKKYGSSSW